MAHVIKRYANRKLYDPQASRYVTHDELATMVRAGEEIQIIDNSTGADITNVVLSKVLSEMISETARKEKGKLPVSVLSEMIQKQSDAVVDYFKQGLAASVRTVKDVEEQLQQRWQRVTKRDEANAAANGSSTTEDLKMSINRMIEESVQYLIGKMNLPTRAEINQLNQRLDEIEQLLKARSRAQSRSKKGSRA